MNIRGIALTIVGAALAGSASLAFVQNLSLRGDLEVDNKMIRILEAGSFQPAATSGVPARDSLVLIPIASSRGSSEQFAHPPAATESNGRCDVCSNGPSSDLTASPMDSSALLLLSLRDRYIGDQQKKHFALFILFSPTDCPACLKEAAVWERLAEDGQAGLLDLNVLGIVDRSSEQESRTAQKQMGITFPVLYDVNSSLRMAFAIPKTPEKILINQYGTVLLTDPGNQTPDAQRTFERAVRAACRH